MKISRTEAFRPDAAGGARTLVVFAGEDGAPGRWLLLDGGAVAARGEAADFIPAAARVVLAVPGTEVAIHWLELEGNPAPAQAAAVARMMLADASAEPISTMHVATGRPERGLTPAALVPTGRMLDWISAAQAAGVDPEAIVPVPLLLDPPSEGLVRHGCGAASDYRGPAAAFGAEPELAELLGGGAAVEELDEAGFEAGLARGVADPVLDLRQGPFARRRQWTLESARLRRMALLALALAGVTLAIQVATLLSYTFAADRLEAEASELSRGLSTAGAAPGPGFTALASVLFEGVRATPNAELTRIEYGPDGTLSATVQADAPATLAALRQRLEASGVTVSGGELRSGGGRPVADLVIRPS